MSDTENETAMSLGEFIADLNYEDPEMAKMLDKILSDYEDLSLKHHAVLERRRDAINKYFKSDKGKEATRKASKKYYDTKKKTGRPVGRPKKNAVVSTTE